MNKLTIDYIFSRGFQISFRFFEAKFLSRIYVKGKFSKEIGKERDRISPTKKDLFLSPIFGVKSTQLLGSNWTMWRVNLESINATLEFEVAKTAPNISALLQMTPQRKPVEPRSEVEGSFVSTPISILIVR